MSRRKNPANLSEDLEMLIISQIMLQNDVKRLLNNEDSDVDEVVENLNDLNQNTNDLTAKLLGEPTSLVTSGLNVDISQYYFYVDLVDSSIPILEGFRLYYKGKINDLWRNWPKETKLFYIVKLSTDTNIKEVHKSLLSECKSENKKLPNEFVSFFEFMLMIRNMIFSPEDQASLYFPKVGSYFDKSEMSATEEVKNGKVIEVLMPGIPKLRLKALVVVR